VATGGAPQCALRRSTPAKQPQGEQPGRGVDGEQDRDAARRGPAVERGPDRLDHGRRDET
jgi:hypothetical protein